MALVRAVAHDHRVAVVAVLLHPFQSGDREHGIEVSVSVYHVDHGLAGAGLEHQIEIPVRAVHVDGVVGGLEKLLRPTAHREDPGDLLGVDDRAPLSARESRGRHQEFGYRQLQPTAALAILPVLLGRGALFELAVHYADGDGAGEAQVVGVTYLDHRPLPVDGYVSGRVRFPSYAVVTPALYAHLFYRDGERVGEAEGSETLDHARDLLQ